MDEDKKLQYAIEEAFAGDFSGLKERSGLQNTDIEMLKNLIDHHFLQFEATVKAHIAMKAKEQ